MGNYAVKGVITQNHATNADFASIPVYYNNVGGYALNAPAGTDYSKLYVGVWVYAVEKKLTAYLTNGNNAGGSWGTYPAYTTPKLQSVSIPTGTWTWVEFSLTHLDLANVTNYDFGIRLIGWKTPVAGEVNTYYIDGLKLYEKEPMYRTTYTTNYTREFITDSAYDYDGDGISYKYSFTHGAETNDVGIASAARGQFLNYQTAVAYDTLLGVSAQIDWANAYVGFYFKQETAFTAEPGADLPHWNFALRFCTSQDNGATYEGSENMTFAGYTHNIDCYYNDTEWHLVEYKLSDLGIHTENVTNYHITLNSECIANGSFYFDGFSIYTK